MSVDFHLAAERAETRIGASAWALLGIQQRADAIYQQLKLLDAERTSQAAPPPPH